MNDGTDPAVTTGSSTGSGAHHFAALESAVDRGDWVAACVAVRAGWFVLAAEGSERTSQLLERVPANILRTQPVLAMELGIVYNNLRFHRIRALRYFVMAIRAARSSRNSDLNPVDRLYIRTAEAGALRLLGRTDSSVAAARAALRILEDLSEDDRATVTDLPRVYSVIGTALYYSGLLAEALDAAERGLAEAPTTPPSNGMGALSLLAGINAIRGDLPQAREHIDYARTGPWTDQQRDGYSGTFYRVAEAILALERFDADTARTQLARLLLDTPTGRNGNERWATIAQMEALTELVNGTPGAGLAGLDAFAALRGPHGRTNPTRTELARFRAILQLALGNPAAAAAIIKRDLPVGVTASVEAARVALALGQTGTALNELRSLADKYPTTRQAAESAAIETAVLLRISPTPRRERLVQRLGALLDQSEQRLAIALLPPRDLARVVEALDSAGFGHVTADLPVRPLLQDVEPDLLLSGRELAVLEQLMETGSISEIAAALVVSTNTVKTQLRSTYRKLGVSGREDAIAVALERHLLVERE
ncbi:response regulator transcription factor [Leifsonia poae]|uniref:response regulator transcription factor n=1 Tax=Leifsonia poae TaxID=110933 RepID=UPI003D66BD4C